MSIALVFAALFVSCSDTMDDKNTIEGGFTKYSFPDISITAEANSYQSIMATIKADNVDGIIEEGVYIVDEQGNGQYISCDSIAKECPILVEKLEKLTSHSLYAYAMTKDGKLAKTENSVTIKTPKMPVFTVDGYYIVTEFEYGDNGFTEGSQYAMAIAFTSGNEKDGGEVEITNFWDGGMTVKGTYNAETKSIVIPSKQLIYVHQSYGDVLMIADEDEDDPDNIILSLEGITYTSTVWSATVSLGNFGSYYVSMKRDF